MRLITIERLKRKIDREDEFKLVMALGELAFQSKRIPGSIQINTEEKAFEQLDKEDVIVVYCTHSDCVASPWAYKLLRNAGYSNVRRYAGGIQEWEEAGYPLEGTDV